MSDLQWDHLVPIEAHEKVLAELEDTRKELEALREQTRWVPIQDGFPDEGEMVECWHSQDYEPFYAHYFPHGWDDPNFGWRDLGEATHWRQIQPPTEQEG